MTQDYLKERLTYDPLTGLFTWRTQVSRSKSWNSKYAGRAAGNVSVRTSGYAPLQIRIDYKLFYASRLAWLYMLGCWPSGEIDHINHDASDTRWVNLREVSRADNMRNASKHKDNTSGYTGVGWFKRDGTWRVRLHYGAREIHGGYFSSLEDAVAKRKELELKYGFHPNHGT